MNASKTILITFLIVNYISNVNGQTKEKAYLVGGNFSLKAYTLKLSNDDISKNISSDYSFNIKPVLGYFFTDNFVIGVIVNYDYSKSYWEEESTDYNIEDKINHISAGPFLRLYLGGTNISPLINVSYCLGKYNISRESENNSDDFSIDAFLTNFNLGGGVAFFFNESVSIDILLYYGKTKLKPKDNENNLKEINSGVSLDIGFQVYL